MVVIVEYIDIMNYEDNLYDIDNMIYVNIFY